MFVLLVLVILLSLQKISTKILFNSAFISISRKEFLDKLENNKKLQQKNHHKSQVEYYCYDYKDENRFITAWDYINANAPESKEIEMNAELKRILVDIFCRDSKITKTNRTNMQNLIKGVKHSELRKELSKKIKSAKVVDILHHRDQIQY
jgi:hypothetical protein